MRRTYRSKKDSGGGIDHRDMVLSVDSKSSIFDAYYIQNIKQVKREMSCVSSPNPSKTVSYKARKRKYVKRLKEPVPLRESLSESAYLTPDKSIHVNRVPDLFDQLLNSSTNVFSPKTGTIRNDNSQNLAQPKIAKRTYYRKKLLKIKQNQHSSSEDSDKENSFSDESTLNTSNLKAHKLVIEREKETSPLCLNDSINKIAKKFPALNKLNKRSTKESSDESGRFSNIYINITGSPLLQTSPQCSTPFNEKYRGKSIYNFSPIGINFLQPVKLINKTSDNIIVSDHNDQCDRSDNKVVKSFIDLNTSRQSTDINKTENTGTNMLQDIEIGYGVIAPQNSFKNEQLLSSVSSSLYTTELEPFLGFPFNSIQKSECDANNLEKNGTDIAHNGTVDGVPETQVLPDQLSCMTTNNINSSLESNNQFNNQSIIHAPGFKNKTASILSESVESESCYDTCDSENISVSSSEEKKYKELIVTVERLNDTVFQKYYKKMLDSSFNTENSNSEVNESDCENCEDLESQVSGDSINNNIDSDIDRFNNKCPKLFDVQIILSSENENSDSNDTEEEHRYLSFVTTRRRNDVTNDSFLLNLDDSHNSGSNVTLDKTVLSYNREKLEETELIKHNTLVPHLVTHYNNSDINSDSPKVKEQIISNIQVPSYENQYTEPLESMQYVSCEELSNINTRKSSRLFRESTCRSSQFHTDETSSVLRQGIVLKPGKKWERSLSIYRRMTTMGDNFNYSILDDESMKSKGRKYRQSVISTMEMQDYQDSLHNESVFSRRSTFVSKPRRSTIKVFKDPNASSISLSSSVLYDDLEGFLNGDCDDTIIELSKLSIGDSGHEVTVLDKFHDTTNRIVTARDYVLRRCNQTDPVLFDECYPDTVLKNCRKIGEGVYGEVFLWRAGDGRARVMKIVPIAGATKVNGEDQKDYHEIISEIVIAMELSALRAPIAEIERHLDDGKEIDAVDLQSVQNATDVFNEVLAIRCVYGAYPSRLLDLWELYDECKGSENDNPAALPVDQQYIVLELANAGQDLESYQFTNAEQACALFKQIALGLAVAEEAFQFEHRDLHWGNVLIAPTDQKFATFVVRGRLRRTARCGVAATLIDYSLSRAARDGRALYNDLAEDEALFDAVGDYQFEVYRLMRDKLGNDWKNFEPYTNILWLHYTVDKMITALRYTRTNTKIHKHYIAKLKEIKNRVLDYGSAAQFILTDNEF